MIYFVIYLVMTLLGTGITLAQHGQPKKGNVNAWPMLLSVALVMWLFYMAGIFNFIFHV